MMNVSLFDLDTIQRSGSTQAVLSKEGFISDERWQVLGPILERPRKGQCGWPEADKREDFEAIVFVLHRDISWRYLPRTFPPKSRVHDYPKA